LDDFNWTTALIIFVSYCSADWLFTICADAIIKRKKLLAANAGLGMYIVGAFGVISYVEDWRYIVPMCIGGWIGTYVSVWHEAVKDKRNATVKETG